MKGPMTKAQLKDFINEVMKEAIGSTLEEQTKLTQERQTKWMGELMAKIGGGRSGDGAEQPKGMLATQFIRCVAFVTQANKSGHPTNINDFAKKTYGADAVVTKALAASTLADGGILVPEQVAQDIIPLLRPASAVYSLNPTIVTMPSGVYAHPKIATGSQAGYIGENKNAPKTGPTTGAVRLTAKKLAALIPLSNDWVRRSMASSDTAVRDDLIRAVSQRGDLAFIRGLGGEFSPRGLRYQALAGSINAANVTVNLANVTTDLGKCVLELANADVAMFRNGWIFAPRTWNYLMTVRDGNGNFAFRAELEQGRLWGWPFKMTTQIPINLGGGTDESEIYLADFSEVMVGETEQLMIDTSTEAAYHDGSAVQAAFSLDQTVIRAIVEHDLGMRQDPAVSILTEVKWI